MNPLAKAYWIGKGVGWDNVPRRVYQAIASKTGLLKKWTRAEDYRANKLISAASDETLAKTWQEKRQRFLPLATQQQLRDLVPETVWKASVGQTCRDALAGQYPFFSRWPGELGWPPNFNLDPVHQISWPVGELWTKTTRSGPPRDDIKLVWEASRFTLAYHLARHYAYTGDERWAEAFWTMFEAWREQNPVNLTVAWGCGQEVAFRLMAVLFGTMVTLNSPHTSAARLRDVSLFAWQSGKRIAANINYAISQENNHALSEAAGLWTVGVLFPELKEAETWRHQGRRVLEHDVRHQVYDDGSFVQHSFSYHRVMLDDLSWVAQLGRRNQEQFSTTFHDRLKAATVWLSQFVDPANGRVPNYGSNDGANILPLACADYLDYRPTLEACERITNARPTLARGPWSEKSLWLLGKAEDVGGTAPQAPAWQAKTGGYHLLRGPNSRLFVRATKFRDRPGQCDQLHVDLWWRGHNLLRDAGSYLYYHRDTKLKNYFYSTAAHNTVSVEDAEQMTKGPNFLWFHWSEGTAELIDDATLECTARIQAKLAYIHHRTIKRSGDEYRIVDRVEGVPQFRVHWRLSPEFAWRAFGANSFVGKCGEREVEIAITGAGRPNVQLGESPESLYYGEKNSCPAIEVVQQGGSLETVVRPIA